MLGGCFHTLSLGEFLQLVDDLHNRVSTGCGRVEITRDGCDDVCILISKTELQSLERALEILAQSAEYQQMCSLLQSVSHSNELASTQA
jgi:hypothetical protein